MTTSLPTSHWLKNAIPAKPAVPTNRRFQAAVIGGGYSGLSAAITLARSGVATVLIEKYYCGYGASGRNAGHLTPTIGKDIPSLLMVYGKDKTKELIHFAEDAVSYTEQVIKDGNIACDYLQSGNIMAAITPGHQKRLEKSAEVARELDVDITWLNNADIQMRGIPPAFISGILENKGGHLHPGKYLAALRQQAIAAGVTIVEGTDVHSYERKQHFFIDTTAGVFEADKLVIATNAFKPLNRYLQSRTVPLTVSLIETEPLNAAQLDTLRWPGREGVYTGHEILESYRLTAQNTIVAGSKIVTNRAGYGQVGVPGKHNYEIVIKAFYERFPQLQDLKIADRFSGPILFTMDFLPIIKTVDKDITTACAYGGHGVAMASYGGKIAAEMAMGKSPAQHVLFTRRIFPLPPDFILAPLVSLIIRILFYIDTLADKKALKVK